MSSRNVSSLDILISGASLALFLSLYVFFCIGDGYKEYVVVVVVVVVVIVVSLMIVT